MKRFWILFVTVALLAAILAAGCATGMMTYIDQKNPITTSVGDKFAIALDSNPTTGFEWEVAYDEGVLEMVNKEYSLEKSPGLVGAGGTQYFTFKALKAGATEITFIYNVSDPVSGILNCSIYVDNVLKKSNITVA